MYYPSDSVWRNGVLFGGFYRSTRLRWLYDCYADGGGGDGDDGSGGSTVVLVVMVVVVVVMVMVMVVVVP